MARKLASIQKVIGIEPIEGKDKIVLATIQGWKVIVQKEQFKVGDLVIYCEIDSVLQEKPEFEFLRARTWIDNGVVKGFRIRSMKMGSVVSQGIAFPVDIVPVQYHKEGLDVTDVIGVKKYERPDELEIVNVPKKWYSKYFYVARQKLSRIPVIGNLFKKDSQGWPEWCIQSDENRIQNLGQKFLNFNAGKTFYITEKMEGCSATFAIKASRFYVMSRSQVKWISPVKKFGFIEDYNVVIHSDNNNNWMKVAKKFNLKQRLAKLSKIDRTDFWIQGEVVGPGIQDNIYKLADVDFYIYGAYNVTKRCWLTFEQLKALVNDLNRDGIKNKDDKPLKLVPILNEAWSITHYTTIESILEDATGTSVLNDTLREGIVFRSVNDTDKISFKAVSNEYLIKHGK